MNSTATVELAGLVLSRVAGLQFTRSGRGNRVRYVVSDVGRGKHLALRPDAYRLLGALDGRRSVGELYSDVSRVDPGFLPDVDAAGRTLSALHAAGLISGDRLPAQARAIGGGPFEAKLVSWRREVVELGPWLPLIDKALGRLFTGAGVTVWAILLGGGMWSLAAHPIDQPDAARWLAQLDAATAFGLYLTFLLLKGVHELGHAAAYRRFAAAEGVRVDSVRAGIALMFMVPFPFTDVSGAWQLAGRQRRIMVGAAGMYVESWAALLGLLIWAWSSDPVMRAVGGQVAAVSSITTVLFNLNPLGRMDGYYIFADLIDRPNLARQASQAALTVLARMTNAVPGRRIGSVEVPMLAYWVGAWLFRATIYAALFWTAIRAGAGIAVAVLLIGGSLLIARPLSSSLRWLLAVSEDRSRTRKRLAVMAAAVIAVVMVPFRSAIDLDGIVEQQGLSIVFPPRPARLADAGPPAFDMSETELASQEAGARLKLATRLWHQALDDGRPEARTFGDEAQAAAEQLRQIESDRARMDAVLKGPDIHLLDLDDRRGSTIGIAGRPVAVRLPSSNAIIRGVIPEATRADVSVRSSGYARVLGSVDTFPVSVRSIAQTGSNYLPSAALGRWAGGALPVWTQDHSGRTAAGQLVEVVLVPRASPGGLRHGQRVEVHLDGPATPLVLRFYRILALAFGAGSRE